MAGGDGAGGEASEAKRPRTDEPPAAAEGSGGAVPEVSVLMPCRNAMPWLPDCVDSILRQEGVTVELLAVDDGSTDASLEWLRECERLCRQTTPASLTISVGQEEVQPGADTYTVVGTGTSTETGSTDQGGGRLGWVATNYDPPSPSSVAERRQPGNSLRVFTVQAVGPSGQGMALNLALRHARAPLIGEMESDDLRPQHTFATLAKVLRDDPTLDAAASQVELIGWPRDGMKRYIEWQNSQLTGQEMADCRFVETIPALRASALYRRDCLLTLRGYRDLWVDNGGTVRDYGTTEEHEAFLTSNPPMRPAQSPDVTRLEGWWPVDSDFWMRFFAYGMRCHKVAEPLYQWRQYPAQSTRTHLRCSLEQLRACKVHFFTCKGGPLYGRRCQVWSIGITLEAWGRELLAAGIPEVDLVSHKPGMPVAHGVAIHTSPESEWVRIFCYGSDRARAKVVKNKTVHFDPGRDWFAA